VTVTKILVAALVALAAAGLAPGPVQADQRQLTQLNVMGQTGAFVQTDANRAGVVNYLVSRANSESPLAISLNELCPSQIFSLAVQLQDYSQRYGLAFGRNYETRFGNCRLDPDSDKAEYGNAILMRYTHVTSFVDYYSDTDTTSTPGSWIARNAVCMTTSAFLNTFRACSTHFTSGSPYPSQENEFAFDVSYNSATWRFALGDLNADRSGLPGSYQTAWREADHDQPTKRPTSDGGGRIDYLYAFRANTSDGPNASIIALGYSDHHIVRGWFVLE
jgi:hypothetical protein